jgi:hypothetical protein
MSSVWRAILMRTILIALLVWLVVASAPLVDKLTGIAIFGNSLREPIKAISWDVGFLLFTVSGWVDAARGRLYGPRPLPSNSAVRYLLLWGRYLVLWVMPLVWIAFAVDIVRSITLVAFGEGAVPRAVNAAVIIAIPVVIYLVYRFLKKYPLQQQPTPAAAPPPE